MSAGRGGCSNSLTTRGCCFQITTLPFLIISSFLRVFRSFKEARIFTRSLKLKNDVEWKLYCKSGKKPSDIPSEPKKVYKDKGYLNLGDWLGTGKIAGSPKNNFLKT